MLKVIHCFGEVEIYLGVLYLYLQKSEKPYSACVCPLAGTPC